MTGATLTLLCAVLPSVEVAAENTTAARVDDAPLITIEEAVRRAKESNASMHTGRARLSAARLASKQAWSYLLPQINARTAWTHYNKAIEVPFGLPPQLEPLFQGAGLDFPPSRNTVIQKQEQLDASIRFDWVIISGRSVPLIKYAHTSVEQAEAGYRQLQATLVTATMLAYHNVVGAQAQVGIRQRSLASGQRHVVLARARFEIGAVQEVETLRAEVEAAGAEQALVLAQNALRKAKLALATLMGEVMKRGGHSDFRVQASAAQTSVGPLLSADRLSAALEQRFDLKQRQLGEVMAGHLADENWLRFFPQVLATGQWRWSNAKGFSGENTAWNVGLALQWELFSGGDTYFGWRRKQLTRTAAHAAVDEMGVAIMQQVRAAEIDYDSAQTSQAVAERRLQLAKRSSALIDAQYEVGAVNQLEVLDAHRARDDADTAAVLAQLEVDVAGVILRRILYAPVN